MSTYTSEPGTRLGGRYRLEDRLAAASGWSAWKAIDEILARPVSVITFASGFPRLEQVVTAARAASRLTDTRLTQVFDVEDDWEHAYIVLEWPFGETLADLLSAGPMEPVAGARIVAEVAAALSGAHAAGLAHLCLRPDAVRWTAGGGVKVTGLGIDAALTGTTADDPELADTRGLGNLLYAALTGLWPGPESPELPAAPQSDGQLRRPRQVRAGVPGPLDEIAARALAIPGREDQPPLTTAAEVAAALATAIPPLRVPPVDRPERDPRREPQRHPPVRRPAAPGGYQAGSPARRGGAVRVAVVSLLVVIAAVGASAAALHLLHKSPTRPSSGRSSSAGVSTTPAAQSAVITPVSASGFDALNLADRGDENSNQAANVLDGNPAGWSTQQYLTSPYLGHLKAGTGLILNLGKPVQVGSVTITFGSVAPGADVQLKMGDSGTRSAANEQSMTTVARKDGVSGTYTFTMTKDVTGQYLVIWFTKLPPVSGGAGKYMGQVFSVVIHGAS